MKRTKIICTIGPATESVAQLERLTGAGMNIARLNFSHGTHENHAKLINNIRTVSKKIKKPIGIVLDLQGPRLRLGTLPASGISVKRGDAVALVYEDDTRSYGVSAHMIALPTQERLERIVKKGELILIKDGLVRMRATAIRKGAVIAEVEEGDILTSNRGINLPESTIPDVVLTSKDVLDVKFGLQKKVDYFALSFVRDANDVRHLRKMFPQKGAYIPRIISKIERQEAVKNFDDILEESDAIMIARGDLGIELAPEEIPLLQKMFIEKCRLAGKPVIVATQMLESMTINPRPTRAEVSDVANAVIDHTDAVMLSGETSTGAFPIETCDMMRRILEKTEASPYDDLSDHKTEDAQVPNIIAQTVDEVVGHEHVKAIVVMSQTGRSARLVSAERPRVPILVFSQDTTVQQQLTLSWGVVPYILKRQKNIDTLITESVKLVRKELAVAKGDTIVIVSGHPTGPHGNLNLLKIHTI